MRWKQRLVCGLDERTNSAGMKTLQVIASTSDNLSDLKYLLAILAPSLINFWCTNYLADDMNQSYLEKIPIYRAKLENHAEKARYDRLASLGDRMITLNKRLPEVKTDHEKTSLQRQIDATDRQIDKLVYELYGLTELDSTFIGAEKHPTRKNQIVLKFEYKEYIWIVPCVVEAEYIFLKTIFPSRKYTIKHNRMR
jgi:hypothetical protein